MQEEFNQTFRAYLQSYEGQARTELEERVASWKIDPSLEEVHESVSALLGRQVTLATHFARNPLVWTDHIAPILLRCMADVFISIAWIARNPLERSRKYILYGLGQLKLELEHRKKLKSEARECQEDLIIEGLEDWINQQRFTFLTEINLGSWSGLNTRKMAEEAECLDFYNWVYTPFSAAVHSSWAHVGRYNLDRCTDPLHRGHGIGVAPEVTPSSSYFLLAGKYLVKTFETFDTEFHVTISVPSAYDILIEFIEWIDDETDGLQQESHRADSTDG